MGDVDKAYSEKEDMTDKPHITSPSHQGTRSWAARWAFSGVILAIGVIIGAVGNRLLHSCEKAFAEFQLPDANKHGYVLKDVNMNELMSWLAKEAKMQYFHNPSLNDPKYVVNGHLKDVDEPKTEIESLAFGFDLHIHIKDDTLHVLTPDQYDQSIRISSEQ